MADILDILIVIFLGGLGIHRFLKKYWITGILWLISGGGLLIGWIIDIIWTIQDKPLIFPQ
ncbi:MAG: TM2 domain-containing protein [Candidatus Heimdallarchaeota archaeon]